MSDFLNKSPLSAFDVTPLNECDISEIDIDDIDIAKPESTDAAPMILEVLLRTPERMDRYLSHAVEHVSREKLKRVILDGGVLIDGVVCTEPKHKLFGGEVISLCLPSELSEIIPVQIELEYIYKGRDFVVLNKPAGLTVHPCPSCMETTLVHGLLYDFPEMRVMGGQRPGIVHRLDKDTSGVMVVALNESARLKLSEAFADRRIKKQYLALVHGVPSAHGVCTEPLGRHPTMRVKMAVVRNGRQAHTDWERLCFDTDHKYALLNVRIHTGRTHQIRVHMTHCGFPLVGDSLYGRRPSVNYITTERQMLHAYQLQIPKDLFNPQDDVSCETSDSLVSFCVRPPQDFKDTLYKLFLIPQRAVLTGCAGSGKSTVLKTLTKLGAKTISADALVHGLYEKGQPAWRVLKNKFGSRIVDPKTEQIDRKELFKIMLADDNARNTVNRLVHPYVNERLDQFWSEPTTSRILIAEVPLWFEGEPSPLSPWRIKTLCVHSEQPLRHERLRASRGWDSTMRETMDSWQLPDHEKCRLSDFVLHNNESEKKLFLETESAFKCLEADYAAVNKAHLLLLESLFTA